MNKVRIGNDIRLFVTLNNTSDWDKKNIKAIKAFLVNTSIRDCEQKCCDFPGRFPRDPQSKFFRPDEHCLNRCGYPHYHATPHCHHHPHFGYPGCCMDHDPNYVFDDGFHRPCWPCGPRPLEYHGFGLEPGRWPHRWFGWTRRNDVAFGHRSPFDAVDLHVGEDWSYLAPSKEVKDAQPEHDIEVFFPAQDQIACGTYKLIVVVVSYNAGWGRDNLHTYTHDFGSIFELVDDYAADVRQGEVIITVPDGQFIGQNQIDDLRIGDIKTEVSHYYITVDKPLKIGETDARGNLYEIYVDMNGDITKWNMDDSVEFESNREEFISVQPNGTISVVAPWSMIKDNPHATISILAGDTVKKIKVTVLDPTDGKILIGFSEYGDIQGINTANFDVYQSGGKFAITNPYDKAYLWVGSPILLRYLDNANRLDTVGITSERFNVPTETGVYYNGRYWYRSVEKINKVTMIDVNIETQK